MMPERINSQLETTGETELIEYGREVVADGGLAYEQAFRNCGVLQTFPQQRDYFALASSQPRNLLCVSQAPVRPFFRLNRRQILVRLISSPAHGRLAITVLSCDLIPTDADEIGQHAPAVTKQAYLCLVRVTPPDRHLTNAQSLTSRQE